MLHTLVYMIFFFLFELRISQVTKMRERNLVLNWIQNRKVQNEKAKEHPRVLLKWIICHINNLLSSCETFIFHGYPAGYIELLQSQVSSPTIIVERAGSYAWTHKSWRVREEFVRTLATAVGLFASTELLLQRVFLSPVCQDVFSSYSIWNFSFPFITIRKFSLYFLA
jgi:hypothetical protein